MVHRVLFLNVESIARVCVSLGYPPIETINLVKSNAERNILTLEKVQGLDGLVLQTVHDIDDKYSQITKRGATTTQVSERLVTWGVNDEEAGQFELQLFASLHYRNMFL